MKKKIKAILEKYDIDTYHWKLEITKELIALFESDLASLRLQEKDKGLYLKNEDIRDSIWKIIEQNTEEKSFGCINCDIDESHKVFIDDNNALFIDDLIYLIERKAISPYNLAHNEIGDCCGVFNVLNPYNGMITCNECKMTLRDAIKEPVEQEKVSDSDIDRETDHAITGN